MTQPARSTLVERLRDPEFFSRTGKREELIEAAARITELEAEVCVLRDVLLNPDPDQEPDNVRLHREKCDALDRALAAESQLERVRAETWQQFRSIIEPWTNAATMTLRAGEMTAQEHRTVQAILSSILDECRPAAPPQQKTEGV